MQVTKLVKCMTGDEKGRLASKFYTEEEESEKALSHRKKAWINVDRRGPRQVEVSVICGLAIAKNTFPYDDEPWSVIHLPTGDILMSFYLLGEAIDARMDILKLCPHIETLDYQGLRDFEKDVMGHTIGTEFPNRR